MPYPLPPAKSLADFSYGQDFLLTVNLVAKLPYLFPDTGT